MIREPRIDQSTMRRYIQQDGLAYPLRLDEAGPQSYHIVDIAHNVRSNIATNFAEMDKEVGELGTWTGLYDFCFEDHEYAWRPRRYVFQGDSPRPTRRPLKNFLRTVLHIKRFKSDRELQAEAMAIQEIMRRYPDRVIKIYNMNTLMASLGACPGVTATPSEIIRYLNVRKAESKYKTYRSSRKYFTNNLLGRKKLLEEEFGKCEDFIVEEIKKNEARLKNVPSQRINAWDKIMMKNNYKKAFKEGQKRLDKLMCAYWEFKLMNDDCWNFSFEYLSTHIANFCKLNPTRPPKH